MPIVNPEIVHDTGSGDKYPQPFRGELIVLRRPGVSFEATSKRYGKVSGSGEVFLSSHRIVFIPKTSSRPDFVSYELEMVEVLNEKFEQPIFGANYISGETIGPNESEKSVWSLTLHDGGCGTILPVLADLLRRARARSLETNLFYGVHDSPIGSIGYLDRSDPSVVLIQTDSSRYS